MRKDPILTSFNGKPEESGFKAILLKKQLLSESYECKREKKDLLLRLKKEISVSFENPNFATLENFAIAEKVRIKIWTQKDYKSIVRLDFESQIENDAIFADYINVDLFSRKFDRFQNATIEDFRLILDLNTFLSGKVLGRQIPICLRQCKQK